MLPIDAKVPDSGSMKAMRTGSWAILRLPRLRVQTRLSVVSSLRIGWEMTIRAWKFLIGNVVLFRLIIELFFCALVHASIEPKASEYRQ